MKKIPIQTQWNLKKHFYSSISDPRIPRDIAKVKRAYAGFAKKYKNKTDYLKSPNVLLTALKDYEGLHKTALAKPLYYLFYLQTLNSSDTKAEALNAKYSQEVSKAANEILFFDNKLGKLDVKTQKRFLKAEVLAPYRYLLERTFLEGKYELSEKEEKLLSLMSLPSGGLWVQGVEKLLDKQTISHKGKTLTTTEAIEQMSSAKTTDRRAYWNKSMKVLKENVSDFAESEINALYTRKKVTDELRGLPNSYSGRVMGNENDEKSIEAMVGAVTDSFPTSRRYYNLKKKVLGLKEMTYADRMTQVGGITRKFSYSTCVDILRESLEAFHPKTREIFDTMVSDGWIDVYPKKGRSGGAFCSSMRNGPTFLLLNHTNDFKSLMTLAHEVGHAIHYELSRSQPPRYQKFSTAAAETASTLFETVVYYHIYDQLTDAEKKKIQITKIDDKVQTIFRQVACFNFEKEMHERVRAEGFVSKEEIAKTMNKHMKAYMGPAIRFTEDDGYFFVKWSHIRNSFYVYTYAYGELVSGELYSRYRQDPAFVDNIMIFLSGGGSMQPDTLFKKVGVDTTKKSFFTNELAHIDTDVRALQRQYRK